MKEKRSCVSQAVDPVKNPTVPRQYAPTVLNSKIALQRGKVNVSEKAPEPYDQTAKQSLPLVEYGQVRSGLPCDESGGQNSA